MTSLHLPLPNSLILLLLPTPSLPCPFLLSTGVKGVSPQKILKSEIAVSFGAFLVTEWALGITSLCGQQVFKIDTPFGESAGLLL